MSLCQCGCGGICKKSFIHGHSGVLNRGRKPNRKPPTEKQTNYYKSLQGEGNPFWGKHHKKETIKQHIEKTRGRHFSPNTEFKRGNKPWNSKLHKESEVYQKWLDNLKLVNLEKGHIPWNKGLTKDQMPASMYSSGRNTKIRRRGNTNGFKKGMNGKECLWAEKRNVGVRRAYAERKNEIVAKIMAGRGKRRFLYESTLKGIIGMRSNWEVIYATYLDFLGIKWQYEPRGIRLSVGLFYPDFYLPELKEWHEVKGYLTTVAQRKLECFKNEYPNEKLLVIDKNIIKSIKIIIGDK